MNDVLRQFNANCVSIAESYERSAEWARKALAATSDGRSKAKYRRQIARYEAAAAQSRRLVIKEFA